jgi:hypothetical protein
MIVRRLAGLLVLSLLIVACSPGPGTGGELQGTDWVLQSYREGDSLTVVPEGLYADAEFLAGRVSGFAGCNEFSAVYRAGGRTLLISDAAVTFRACDEVTSAFETSFLTLLQESRFYSARRHDLTIFDGDGSAVLVFDAAPRNPLLGRWIVDSYATAPNSLSAPLEGTELTPSSASRRSADPPAATRSPGRTERTATSSGSAHRRRPGWPASRT